MPLTLPMLIPMDGEGPLYLQLYRSLRHAILHAELAPGSRLPASRSVAREMKVSRNVVLLAYDQLRAEGYIEGRVGAGTFVTSPLPDTMLHTLPSESPATAAAPPPLQLSQYARRAIRHHPRQRSGQMLKRPRYDFRFGDVAINRSGMNDWKRLLNRHADRLFPNHREVEGYPPLREAIAEYVYRSRGIVCRADQIIVVNGTQQALDLIARVFLDPDDRVVIEEPHYAGAREVFLAAGAELIACPVDHEGLPVEQLPAAGARLVYVTPSHQFPTGAVMPLTRRLALLDWAQRFNAYVIEDDYDSEYRYEGRPVEAVQALDRGGRTIYIGTFSKILFPALRLGFLIVPPQLIEPFVAAKYLADRHTAMLNQAVLADFINEGHFERHLRRMRAQNETRRSALLEALDEHLGARVTVTGTNAGVHLAVWLHALEPAAVDDLIERAGVCDVGIYSINPSFYQPPPRAGLLLGYASLTVAEIREGIRRFAGVLADYQ
jgi:GntR family transcriptional regulator/MocR family aminotransferase